MSDFLTRLAQRQLGQIATDRTAAWRRSIRRRRPDSRSIDVEEIASISRHRVDANPRAGNDDHRREPTVEASRSSTARH